MRTRRPAPGPAPRPRADDRLGFSLFEVMITVAVIGILTAVAVPRLSDWVRDSRLRATAHDLAGAFRLARAQAMRTGNAHIVFVGEPGMMNEPITTPNATPFPTSAESGRPVLAWVVNDGAFGTGDCNPVGGSDADGIGTTSLTIGERVDDLSWGTNRAGTTMAPNDLGMGAYTMDGSSFQERNNNGSLNARGRGVAFRPDGVPVAIPTVAVTTTTAPCTFGQTGTGAGALYLRRTGGAAREYAVVLSPLGSVQVYSWDGTMWR